MPALHVAQINVLPAPEGLGPAEILERWPSLVDIAEAASSPQVRISVIQAAARTEKVTRNGIDYHFIDVRGMSAATRRGHCFAVLLAEIAVDVLHVHGLRFAEDAFAIAQRLPGLPILFQDHADRPAPWWRRPQWRRWYAVASAVVFTTQAQSMPFTACGLFAPSTRLFDIPESSSRFMPGNQALARAETGLYGKPCVLWVGHLSSGKDPLTVLDGIALAAARLPDMQLWCAFGRAPLLAEVRRRVERDPALAGRVHLLGEVPHARVERLMQAADLFVSGSRSESSGYALLEALASGLAPVVTDIPSFRALSGGVGSLWPCGDAARLAQALTASADSRPSPERVRAHFDSALSFAALGQQWAQVYAQVHGERRCGIS